MDLREECLGAKKIGISGHIRPDGDCVGVCLSLQMYLRKLLPEAAVTVYLQKPFDVYFALDCSPDRLGDAEKYFQNAKKKINIDHHISNSGCGDVNLVRPEVGSACEVLYHIMDAELIDKDIAEALYTGIIHDTGVFQYSNTTPETLQAAAFLISFGFDFSNLMESIRFMDGRCIVSMVDRKTMDFYNAVPGDLDGIVNQLRNIKGIDCAIFMYETGVLEYKVSMRSNENVDVAKVASFFGGGGHVRAAGCTMKGTFHDCVNNLSLHIDKQLRGEQD